MISSTLYSITPAWVSTLIYVADFLADQGLSYRRLVGDLALQAVCLGGTYQILNSISSSNSTSRYLYCAADADLVQIHLIFYYDFRILQDLLDLLDSCLDIALLVLCCVVLGVLGEVSLLSGLLDLSCYFFSAVYF